MSGRATRPPKTDLTHWPRPSDAPSRGSSDTKWSRGWFPAKGAAWAAENHRPPSAAGQSRAGTWGVPESRGYLYNEDNLQLRRVAAPTCLHHPPLATSGGNSVEGAAVQLPVRKAEEQRARSAAKG